MGNMDANHDERFKTALSSEEPTHALETMAWALKSEGMTQVEMFVLFARFQDTTTGDDPLYDAIVDTMDLVAGGPWAKGRGFFETELSSQAMADALKL